METFITLRRMLSVDAESIFNTLNGVITRQFIRLAECNCSMF